MSFCGCLSCCGVGEPGTPESDTSKGWEQLSGHFKIIGDGFTQLKQLLGTSECIKN